MKKTFCIVLAFFMLSLVGCEKSATTDSSDPPLSSIVENSVTESSKVYIDPNPYRPVFSDEVHEKLALLNLENEEAIGWIEVPGTDISLPIMHKKDDISYYLSHDEYDIKNPQGAIYLGWGDIEEDKTTLSPVTHLLGHNLGENQQGQKDDPDSPVRFAQLLRFADEEVARANPYIPVLLGEESFLFEIFSVSYIDVTVPYPIPDYLDFWEMVYGEFRDRSLYDYDVDVTQADELLLLQCCTFEFGADEVGQSCRFIIVGKLVDENENLKETASFTINEDWKKPDLDMLQKMLDNNEITRVTTG